MYWLVPAGKIDERAEHTVNTADITQLHSSAQKDTDMVEDCWISIVRESKWMKGIK